MKADPMVALSLRFVAGKDNMVKWSLYPVANKIIVKAALHFQMACLDCFQLDVLQMQADCFKFFPSLTLLLEQYISGSDLGHLSLSPLLRYLHGAPGAC